MNDDQNQIVTILYELCQSLIFSLEMTLDNHERFVEVIDRLSPIISRTNLVDYFEKTKKSIIDSTKLLVNALYPASPPDDSVEDIYS